MVAVSKIIITLADARIRIRDAMPDLPAQKRRHLVCSLNRFSAGSGLALNAIGANPTDLARVLEQARPAAANITAKNWRNIVSGTMAALRVVGIDIQPARDTEPMSPPWKTLHNRLPEHTYSLSRAFRFFTRIGIEPSNIAPEHFDQFAQALEMRYAIENWALRDREARKAWNQMVNGIEGWPKIIVPLVNRRPSTGVPTWNDLPATLVADRKMYLDFRARPYLSDEDFAANLDPLRESSLRKLDYCLRQAAGMMRMAGIELSSITNIAKMVEPVAFKACRDALMKKCGQDGNSQGWNVLCALTGAAALWIYKNEDHTEVKRLQKLAKKLKPRYDGMTDKNKRRLRKAIEPENFKKLACLPRLLASLARDPHTSHASAAHLMQMAIAIRLLLAVAPVRVGTLAKTLVGTHIFGTKPNLGGDVLLHYPEGIVKNSVELDFGVDPETVALLREYMDEFRPRLIYGHAQALFPGEIDDTKGENTLAHQISEAIRRHTGLDFNPHLFRHLTGFLYLCQHPGDYLAVQRALGHKSLNTTMTFYVWMEKDKLVRQYQQTILGVVEAA